MGKKDESPSAFDVAVRQALGPEGYAARQAAHAARGSGASALDPPVTPDEAAAGAARFGSVEAYASSLAGLLPEQLAAARTVYRRGPSAQAAPPAGSRLSFAPPAPSAGASPEMHDAIGVLYKGDAKAAFKDMAKVERRQEAGRVPPAPLAALEARELREKLFGSEAAALAAEAEVDARQRDR